MIYHLLSNVFMFIVVALPVVSYITIHHPIIIPKETPDLT